LWTKVKVYCFPLQFIIESINPILTYLEKLENSEFKLEVIQIGQK
jgi:hypothetical protein